MKKLCQFGDHMVDPNDPDTYHEITAWVSGPKKDGGVLRRQTSRVACKPCINALRAGHAPGEGDLFTIVPSKIDESVNRSSPAYRVGWTHGFLGIGCDPDLNRNSDYAVAFLAGRELAGHLDGFFFFEDSP